ncbi:MAG: dTDP-4-dehydrorhamnose reductase [Winogradskyella sp.]
MKKVAVLGASGQLGQSLYSLVNNSKAGFEFFTRDDVDITKKDNLERLFSSNQFRYCINCAAYTNVELSETNKDLAFLVNSKGVKNIAEACHQYNVVLIHISTDYVFDGSGKVPYKTTDVTNPINEYGKSKLQGELNISEVFQNYYIIRTSWLYSEYGSNFLKTMLRLSTERDQLGVVGDQIGTPTYAKDLAETILHIIENKFSNYGIYHYSNNGVATWYDFAKAIFDISGVEIQLENISTSQFTTRAKRPQFSVLNKKKTQINFKLRIPYWRDSLKKAIQNLDNERLIRNSN